MKTKNLVALTVICIAFTQMGGAGLAPLLSDLAAAFPQVPAAQIQLVSTLPAVFIVAASYLAVRAAKHLQKKQLIFIGTALILLFAILGYVCHSSIVILYVWSAVLGTGVGICNTLATVFINDYFEGQEKISLLGRQTFAASAGLMIMTYTGGLLVQRKWYLGYLPYLIILPAMILSFTVLPGEKREAETGRNRKSDRIQKREPVENEKQGKTLIAVRSALFPMFTAFMVTMLYTVCVTNIGMYISDNGFGTAAQTGTVMTLLSMSGGICGLLLGRVTSRIGTRKTMCLGFAMMAIGYLGFWKAGTFPAVIAAALLSGGAISFVMPGATFLAAEGAGRAADEAIAATLMSSNLGNLISPVLTILTPLLFGSGDVRKRFLLGAILSLLVMGFLSIRSIREINH